MASCSGSLCNTQRKSQTARRATPSFAVSVALLSALIVGSCAVGATVPTAASHHLHHEHAHDEPCGHSRAAGHRHAKAADKLATARRLAADRDASMTVVQRAQLHREIEALESQTPAALRNRVLPLDVMGSRVRVRGRAGEAASADEEEEFESRGGESLANVAGFSWVNLTFAVNTTFLRQPALDLLPTGMPLTCTSAGEWVYPTTDVSDITSTGWRDCFNEETPFQWDCKMQCEQDDVPTAAQWTRFETIFARVAAYFTQSLQVLVPSGLSASSKVFPVESIPTICALSEIEPNSFSNAPMTVFLTARSTRPLNRSAYGFHCSLLPSNIGFGRPGVAQLNVAPQALRTSTDDDLFMLMQHELIHALGWTNELYGSYIHPDSTSGQLYRDYNPSMYPTGPVTGAGAGAAGGLNSSAIVDGQDVVRFVGPNTLRIAKGYFGCSSLTGVELENGGSTAYAGDHWEKRILYSELMAATRAATAFLSYFTLGLLTDSGWYKAASIDASTTTDPTMMVFGRNLGCNWATQRCNTWPSVSKAENYFCTELADEDCGFDGRFVGSCTLQDWQEPIPFTGFQYFASTYGPNYGGDDLFADYCPMFRQYVDGQCYVSANADTATSVSRIARDGVSFSPGARCFSSDATSFGYVAKEFGGACYPSVCARDNSRIYIVVGDTLVDCTGAANTVVELVPAVSRLGVNVTTDSSATVLQYSFSHYGTIRCGRAIEACSQLSTSVTRMTTAQAEATPDVVIARRLTHGLPVIASVSPNWGLVTDATAVYVIGTNFVNCTGVKFGGIPATGVSVVNSTHIKATPGSLRNDSYGGELPDGTGYALVEVLCSIEALPTPAKSTCTRASPCVAASAANIFNYTVEDPYAASSSDGGEVDIGASELLDSTPGKIILVIVCVTGAGAIAFIVRGCFVTSEDEEEEVTDTDEGEDEDALGGSPTKPAVPQQQAAAATGVIVPGGGVIGHARANAYQPLPDQEMESFAHFSPTADADTVGPSSPVYRNEPNLTAEEDALL